MVNATVGGTPSETLSATSNLCRVIRLCCAVLVFLMALIPVMSRAQTRHQAKRTGAAPAPVPAVPAILAAFDKYEVVGMPEAHGMKDVDDFILSLIRNPAFPKKVNDIEVECGNSLYQPVLDRYIAGEDVPFTEVRKVWRNTTQLMCGMSGFFEQFFPLVRAINQKLPPGNRLRVLAGDPPIDWDQVKTFEDVKKHSDRTTSIASVMEKEVLSKHRKALMLFGNFHLFHGQAMNAVSIYEKDYPNLTFVIAELAFFDTDLPGLSSGPFVTWPVPSIARAKGTWLGALDLSHFFPPPIFVDENCNAHNVFPASMQKPMEDLVDAFLYLGPQDLRLKEQMPADIALDVDYRMELLRRETLTGFPGAGTLKEFDQQIVNGVQDPLFGIHPPDLKAAAQSCLDRKSRGSTSHSEHSEAPSQKRPATLTRDYREGEAIFYRMKAVNEGHLRTIRYEAQANARVRRESSGILVEDFAWSGLVVNDQPIPLTPASQQFREDLSLSPEYTLSVPDLGKVQPILIGPITDLLTFYADVQLAMRQKNLVRAGDHIYVKHGTPNSWADGTYTVFGQDSIDFDITLTEVDEVAHEAKLVIRHVPPAQAQIQFPAMWMVAPVGNLPNNWVEVEKGGQGKYSAEVGKETFEVVIRLSLPSGRIVSAEMDNPVDVLGRECDDAALSKCGAPNRYGIRRQVYLSAEKP